MSRQPSSHPMILAEACSPSLCVMSHLRGILGFCAEKQHLLKDRQAKGEFLALSISTSLETVPSPPLQERCVYFHDLYWLPSLQSSVQSLGGLP